MRIIYIILLVALLCAVSFSAGTVEIIVDKGEWYDTMCDGYIKNYNYGGLSELWLGRNLINRDYVILLAPIVSDTLEADRVVSATCYLKMIGFADPTPAPDDFYLLKGSITHDWVAGTRTPGSYQYGASSWNNYGRNATGIYGTTITVNDSAWNTPEDYSGPSYGFSDTVIIAYNAGLWDTGGWISFDCKDEIVDIINGNGYGIYLSDTAYTDNDMYWKVYSMESAAANQPLIEIVYDVTPAAPDNPALSSQKRYFNSYRKSYK